MTLYPFFHCTIYNIYLKWTDEKKLEIGWRTSRELSNYFFGRKTFPRNISKKDHDSQNLLSKISVSTEKRISYH